VLRIMLVSFFLLLSIGSFFAVLFVEEDRRLAKVKADQDQFLNNARAVEQARQAYLESVAQSRDASKQGMATAKTQYEQLLKDQPSLVQKNQKQTTTSVPTLVPVASSSNVSSAQTTKPKAATKTKTS
ncbi:MAG: hypothetical protein WCG73_01575, partial [Candidatus Moraniibacteriota bacterium]